MVWQLQIKKRLLNKKKINKKTNVFNFSLYLLSLCILMLGFSYASVPLYQLYCQVTGLGGIAQETNQYEIRDSQDIVKSSFKLEIDKNEKVDPVPKRGPIGEEKQYNSSDFKDLSSEKNIVGVYEKTEKGMNKLEEEFSGNERKALTIHFNSETSENMP